MESVDVQHRVLWRLASEFNEPLKMKTWRAKKVPQDGGMGNKCGIKFKKGVSAHYFPVSLTS